MAFQVKPSNPQELKDGIRDFWENELTVDVCRNYISNIRKFLPAVIEANGGPTEF